MTIKNHTTCSHTTVTRTDHRRLSMLIARSRKKCIISFNSLLAVTSADFAQEFVMVVSLYARVYYL